MFKLILTSVLVFTSLTLFSQELSAEEQRKLLEDVQSMKEKLNKIENKPSTGLKKVNYENETTDKQESSGTDKDLPALSPEQSEKLKADVEVLKQKQLESNKMLEELDKDEE